MTIDDKVLLVISNTMSTFAYQKNHTMSTFRVCSHPFVYILVYLTWLSFTPPYLINLVNKRNYVNIYVLIMHFKKIV